MRERSAKRASTTATARWNKREAWRVRGHKLAAHPFPPKRLRLLSARQGWKFLPGFILNRRLVDDLDRVRLGTAARLEPADVGFDLLGHLEQDIGGAAVEDRFGQAAALLGPRAHIVDDGAVRLAHRRVNSPLVILVPLVAPATAISSRSVARPPRRRPSPIGTAANRALRARRRA